MTFSKLLTLLVLALAVSFAGAGCKSKNPPVTTFGPGASRSGDGSGVDGGLRVPGSEPVGFGGGEAALFNPDDMAQDRTTLAPQTIYFALDSSEIDGGERPKLEAVASALRSDSSAKLLIEGHCDERGTEEYNRSLGERRALAAREALAVLGIDPGRIATRSYGEDRAADPGHSESAWKNNRRDEFVLLHAR